MHDTQPAPAASRDYSLAAALGYAQPGDQYVYVLCAPVPETVEACALRHARGVAMCRSIDEPDVEWETYEPPPLEVIYVGRSANLQRRMSDHAQKWWWPTVDLGESWVTAHTTKQEAVDDEVLTITYLRPCLNLRERVDARTLAAIRTDLFG